MKETDNTPQLLKRTAVFLPDAPDVASMVWVTGLCLMILALISSPGCSSPSAPNSSPAAHTRPTLTSTPTGTPTPSETPSRTPTPTATEPPCVYDSELDEIRDRYGASWWYVGSTPSIGLVLRNSGACPWPEDSKLVLVSGNTLDWPESWPVGTVGVDERKEVEVNLTAPSTPQRLLVAWQLVGSEGQVIGSEITHTIRFEWPATATPSSPSPAPDQPTPGGGSGPSGGPTPTRAQPPKPTPTRARP